ncbi:hypothetical protein BCR35DRAFT_304112 [Leucosporidium creatinivorum]|uniref:Fucosyltransferase n=1 Tax=Leucosporidium creatinivorum TaxID=106004 RepID=A0A1Y2FCA8_9BASI|nr:hypothetical protein BCR35DRAFT_304112 [Leucosporidium creatinivorum]
MNWNVFRGSILGLSESKRNLRPWQKVALMSLEPNSFARWHLGRLKMFDMLTSFAHAEKIHEYYTRPLCSPRLDGRCVGIADIDSTMADTLWGRSREESPFPPLPLSLPDDGKLHLATFISNCAPKARARLIKDLVKEGVVFEHFGKCREDVFGGTPSPIVAEVEAALNTSRRVLQPGLVKEQILPLYPFTLALENTILSSYVTEKVHDALISPSVPLILGAPNLASEIQPESASEWPVFIDVTHYSPAELVSEMKRLMSAKDERRAYKSWLAHFGEEETTEPKIIRYFKRLQANDGSKWGSHYMRPICMMCEWYHEFYDFEGDVPLGFGDEK